MKYAQQPFHPTLAFITALGLLLGATACGPILQPLPDSVQTELDNALEYGFDGLMVYVDRAGEDPAYYAAGVNNRESQVPVDSQDLFKIASISKLYIATAVAKLAATGTLSLDRTLAEYLPKLSDRIENADEITLRMLVQHRSGIPNFIDEPDFDWDEPPYTSQESLELVLDGAADFRPDKWYKYSNTNFLLLGYILDQTLGYSHHRYIEEEILIPLGLNNTYNVLSEAPLEEVMSGYSEGWPYDIKPNEYRVPGGSMVASIRDVGVFLRALNDGSLLNEDEQAINSSIYRYEHTGLLPGYQSIARYHADIDAVVIQFNNTSGGTMWAKGETVYRRVMRIVRRD
ncbi:MAG TPA: serine hydrolase [Cytophagales bacterium]|nr:serine hydrolase [Cytophagales bacterium]